MDDLDRVAVGGEDRVEALVGARRLVGGAAAQLDAGGGERPLDVVEVDLAGLDPPAALEHRARGVSGAGREARARRHARALALVAVLRPRGPVRAVALVALGAVAHAAGGLRSRHDAPRAMDGRVQQSGAVAVL